MQETNTHSRLKQIVVILACLLGAVAVGWGAIFVLKNLGPTRTNNSPPLNQALSPEEVIAQYAVPELSENAYSKQIDQAAQATIIYKSTVATYAIDASAKHTVLFTAKNTSHPNNSQTVQQQTTSFMTQHGLKEIANVGSATSSQPSYKTYENDKTVCQQSSNYPETSTTPSFYTLYCAAKTSIQTEYAATNSLLNLYKSTAQLPVFTEVSRTKATEGNKSMTVLTLIDRNKATSLLFAAIDDTWSYVGNLSDNAAESNGKYSISVDTQQAIKDPKWGDFLTRHLQVQ